MNGEQAKKRRLIGYRLNIARKRAGLSQSQVSDIIGLSRPSISEIEAGRRRVAAEELAQLAEIYQVDMDWLAGRGVEKMDPIRDKLELAARNLKSMKDEDLEKVIDLLSSLKSE